jgi:ATP-binding cassette subfamily G (WHITE) protein 2 (SNQ2)
MPKGFSVFYSRFVYLLLIIFAHLYLFRFKRNKGTPFDILHEVSAFCKDGEMLLVLGRPGAGCSSFLRVVSNIRKIFLNVDGDVM